MTENCLVFFHIVVSFHIKLECPDDTGEEICHAEKEHVPTFVNLTIDSIEYVNSPYQF